MKFFILYLFDIGLLFNCICLFDYRESCAIGAEKIEE